MVLCCLVLGVFTLNAAETTISITPGGKPAYTYHEVGDKFVFTAETNAPESNVWWTASAGGQLTPASGSTNTTLEVTDINVEEIYVRAYVIEGDPEYSDEGDPTNEVTYVEVEVHRCKLLDNPNARLLENPYVPLPNSKVPIEITTPLYCHNHPQLYVSIIAWREAKSEPSGKALVAYVLQPTDVWSYNSRTFTVNWDGISQNRVEKEETDDEFTGFNFHTNMKRVLPLLIAGEHVTYPWVDLEVRFRYDDNPPILARRLRFFYTPFARQGCRQHRNSEL